MKIAITAATADPASKTDDRFGRCAFFYIYDTETKDGAYVENPATTAAEGAGIKAVETVAKEGVSLVITGRVGPKADTSLKAANIALHDEKFETVQDAVAAIENGSVTLPA